MRKLLILLIIAVSPILAQVETLVGDGFHSGGYGGLLFRVGIVKGEAALFSGGRGAWIINHRFAIGGGGYSMLTDVKTDAVTTGGNPLYMKIHMGGLELEYIEDSDKLLHWTFLVTLGGGTVAVRTKGSTADYDSDEFFVMEPNANMDLNINKWFRIGVGVSYRFAIGVDNPYAKASDVSGPSIGAVFKFGAF